MTIIKEILTRLIILVFGLTIAHIGVTLFLLANLGSDPFNVLIQGLFRTLSALPGFGFLTHGYTHMSICFIIIVALLIIDRSYIKIGTLVCMLLGGPIIDVCTILFGSIINENSPYIVRIIGLVLGCIILAFGMTIVIKSESGTGPNDLVAVVISDKSHKPFSVIRIITDVCFAAIGFFLGGNAFIGTVICAFLVGPVAGFFMPFNQAWIERVVEKMK
ncbi:MAG: hypothetical protein E7267_03980 [Lachnospiraceae bacterium]|nr:hypothetical protein [Lachnospiraceae bacterium]